MKYIVLENGSVFRGESFGADKDVMAELIFSTGSVGFISTLTDKAYLGQAVVQTFPAVGNYGIVKADAEGDSPACAALIVRDYCRFPSNFRCDTDLDSYMKEIGVVGVFGIDTRAVTRIIREQGSMKCAIVSDPSSVDIQALKSYKYDNIIADASIKAPVVLDNNGSGRKIAVLDLGMKKSFSSLLLSFGCSLYVYPYNTDAKTIASVNPDALFVVGGPENPAEYPEITECIKSVIGMKIPVFGVGSGHLALAAANGYKTFKLNHGGHHSCGAPVRYTKDGRIFIAALNHSYAVCDVDENAEITMCDINDKTIEGIKYKAFKGGSIQFYPEADGGTLDTTFIIREFLESIG